MTFVLLFIIAVCFFGLFLLYRLPKEDKPIAATPLKNSAAEQPAECAEQAEQPSAAK